MTPSPAIPRRRWARWGGPAVLAILAAMAALHLPLVRPWLAARGTTGGAVCPFGYGGHETAAGRQARHDRIASLRGTSAARERPALGFALDRATKADLDRWAQAHGVHCEPHRGGTRMACSQVPAGLLSGTHALDATSLVLTFADDGTLASILAVRRGPDADGIAAAFAATEHQLTAHAGPPVARDGDASAANLAAATLRQAMIEYRFKDYRAVVRATNLGDGFVLTEEYATLTRL